jgi:hypothetical protein
MGHKGVSKRKPKKSGPVSGVNINGSPHIHSAVQSLVNEVSTGIAL